MSQTREEFDRILEITTTKVDAGTEASYYAFFLHGFNFGNKEYSFFHRIILSEREQTIKQLEEKIERQKSQISQLKQEKHKLRQEKALFKQEANENDRYQKEWFNRAWKAEHKLQRIDKYLKEECADRQFRFIVERINAVVHNNS